MDFNQMNSIHLRGKYETSNRHCERVFGSMKQREITSIGSSFVNIADMTVAQVNNLSVYLKKMSKKKRGELWRKIDSSNDLKTMKEVRKQL
ncbi:Oidioi.mRNA.OKI2018_I69.YSR.g17102.t1.cds [Oikopleura dioica]|uniref:Oidioi.mRNA.OKI2018_I69.YSR.g17102.t1.cds n=1 Tax=Oikopleura dioica TaxID=34765 RepID=A0ABN7SI73_OIKDI|nr:Oidioi.mRNA.OKI2018_I69.YSR.g17102.t1.cds [Oikopleura dioica]